MSLGDFSPQAEAYSRSRPSYPDTLIDALVRVANVAAGETVADLGAGTGILTAMLADRGLSVTAVEPNASMRENALEVAGVEWVDGTFEASGLPDHSQGWAVAAQAFHWADPPRALPEIRRILRPGRCLTVLWNNRENDRHAVLVWTRAAIARHVPEFEPAYREIEWGPTLVSTGDFGTFVYREERHVVPMGRERYLDLWRSHNRLNTTAGPERFAKFIEELEAYLTATETDVVDVPYLCRAWTARAK